MFRYEREMAHPVRQWLENRGLITAPECQLPWGVCDFVAVSLYKRKVEQRLKMGQRSAIGNPVKVHLIDLIPDQEQGYSITARRLYKEMCEFCDSNDVDSMLSALKRSNFVVEPRKNHFQKLNGWMPLHKTIIAVEMKLNRVPDVLSQAYSNLRIADKSYIALPKPVAHRVVERDEDRIRHYGIGVIGVSSDKCRVLLSAQKKSAHTDREMQNWLVERFWVRYQRQESISS